MRSTILSGISPSGQNDVDITLRHHSPFVLEALDSDSRSPGQSGAGTGPFEPAGPASPTELVANDALLSGPASRSTESSSAPIRTVRAAWAEMLRDHLDMLYEVGTDALDSLERSNKISVFTYIRHYQYVIVFNTRKRQYFDRREVRQALSHAIDRSALVRDALNGHGIPSAGPIWPHHWALGSDRRRSSGSTPPRPQISWRPGGIAFHLPGAARLRTHRARGEAATGAVGVDDGRPRNAT